MVEKIKEPGPCPGTWFYIINYREIARSKSLEHSMHPTSLTPSMRTQLVLSIGLPHKVVDMPPCDKWAVLDQTSPLPPNR